MSDAEFADLLDQAHARAQLYAPTPSVDPINAGAAGAAITGVIVGLFSALAGMPQNFAPAAVVTMLVLGFVLPFLWLRAQEREHYRAFGRELTALRNERAATRPLAPGVTAEPAP